MRKGSGTLKMLREPFEGGGHPWSTTPLVERSQMQDPASSCAWSDHRYIRHSRLGILTN